MSTDLNPEGYENLIRILHTEAPLSPPGRPIDGYRSAFKRWDERASVRRMKRLSRPDSEGDALLFPPELVPAAGHPLVTAPGEQTVRAMLGQYLYSYLNFTTWLEQDVVTPVTQLISRARLGVELPEAMLVDAFKICTDEAYHAQFSDELSRQITARTGIMPQLPEVPHFLLRLDGLQNRFPVEMRGLVRVLFTIVSETLISSTLKDIPHDERVHPVVREILGDHAQDEGRHHAYFSDLLKLVWPALSRHEQALAGRLVPELITIFLEPDHGATILALASIDLKMAEIEQVIAEAYPSATVRAGIRDASQATVRYFTEVGALEEPGTREAFQQYEFVA